MGVTMGAKTMSVWWRLMLTAPGIVPFIQLPYLIYMNIDSPSWMLDRYSTKIVVTNRNTYDNEYKINGEEETHKPDAKAKNAGRQLEYEQSFEEKYGFRIEQQYLDKILKDFNKIYKPDSADLAFEDLLLIQKEKYEQPQPDFKDFMKDGFNRYVFFVAVVQNFLARFCGMNHFQFYVWYQTNKLSHLNFDGSWALLAMCVTAFISLIIFIGLAGKIDRKLMMMVGVFIQMVCLIVVAVFNSNIDVSSYLFIPMMVLYTIGFTFGMESAGILFTQEALPPCAIPHAMYCQWLAGAFLCFTNFLAFKTSVEFLMYVFATCCGLSFLFLGLLARETRGKTLAEQKVSYKSLNFFK